MKKNDFTALDLILTAVLVLSILAVWALEPQLPVRVIIGAVDIIILAYLLSKIYRILFWLSKK